MQVVETYGTKSLTLPPFQHDGSRVGRADVIEYWLDELEDWPPYYFLIYVGLEGYSEGDDIKIADILEVLAGEEIISKVTWTIM